MFGAGCGETRREMGGEPASAAAGAGSVSVALEGGERGARTRGGDGEVGARERLRGRSASRLPGKGLNPCWCGGKARKVQAGFRGRRVES